MKIIISPAKKMKEDLDFITPRQLPQLLSRTETLLDYLRGLSLLQLKTLLNCNEEIAKLNFQRFAAMDLTRRLTPAILAYEGIQYQYMAPAVFTEGEFDYIQERLRILSGFYGVLRPFDGVAPYRLEMQAKLKTDFCCSLYDFWRDDIFRALTAGEKEPLILNLASEEYAKAVIPFAAAQVGPRVITPVFGERIGGRIVEKGVYVKMARGEMVRFLAERKAQAPDELLSFDRLGYRYCPEVSSADRPVFLKETAPRAASRRASLNGGRA